MYILDCHATMNFYHRIRCSEKSSSFEKIGRALRKESGICGINYNTYLDAGADVLITNSFGRNISVRQYRKQEKKNNVTTLEKNSPEIFGTI